VNASTISYVWLTPAGTTQESPGPSSSVSSPACSRPAR
jgi:hypothetical protein